MISGAHDSGSDSAPTSKAPHQRTAITGRFSGLRIKLLAAPSPRFRTWHDVQGADPRMALLRRSSPITAAGPRWIRTTFPFIRPKPDTGNRDLFTCQSCVDFRRRAQPYTPRRGAHQAKPPNLSLVDVHPPARRLCRNEERTTLFSNGDCWLSNSYGCRNVSSYKNLRARRACG